MATFLVPAGYADDNVDHGQQIIDYIKTVPDGTPGAPNFIFFAPGVYRSEKTIFLDGRNNLVLNLNGATVKNTVVFPYTTDGSGFYPNDPNAATDNFGRNVFEFHRCTNIRIAFGTLQGAGPSTPVYTVAVAAQCGILFQGGSNIEVDHLTIKNVYGDFIELLASGSSTLGTLVPTNVHVHDCTMTAASRQGFTVAGGQDVLFEHNNIGNVARHLIDLESDFPDGSADIVRVTIRANTFGFGRLGFVACAGKSHVVSDITVGGLLQADGNTLSGTPISMAMTSASAGTGVYWRNQNILVGWNTSNSAFGTTNQPTHPSGMISLLGWDGATVVNNTGPLGVGRGNVGVLLNNCSGYQGNIHNNTFTNAITEWFSFNPFGVQPPPPPPPPPPVGWDSGDYDDGTYDDATVVAPPSTPPGPPRGVSGTAGNAKVLVSWLTPTTDGGQPITSWIVTPYVGAVAQAPVPVQFGPLNAAVNATNGTTYTYTVRAINTVGTGTESAHSGPVTPTAPATVPDVPTITGAVAVDSFVGINWTLPANGGAPIIGYIITLYIGGLAQAPVSVSAARLFGFVAATNGTTYTATVRAVNSVGQSGESAPSSAVTPAAAGTGGGSAPGTPTGVTAQPGDSNAIVFWAFPSDGGSVITGYTVTPYIAGVAQTPTAVTGQFPATIVTGLTNGTAYTFKVTATNANGTSAQSAASAPVTPVAAIVIAAPAVPSGLIVTAGDGVISLVWSVPANGGAPIVSYTVTTYVGGVAVGTEIVPADLPFANLTVTNNVTYRFTVFATNLAGSSAESSLSVPVTPEAVVITPPPPPPPSFIGRCVAFNTPTEFVVPPISDDAPALSNALFRHYQNRPRGRTIWELPDGTLTFVQPYPTIEDTGPNRESLYLAGSSEWSNLTAVTYKQVFLGGHEYDIPEGDDLLHRMIIFLTDAGYDYQDWLVPCELGFILASDGTVIGGLDDSVMVGS